MGSVIIDSVGVGALVRAAVRFKMLLNRLLRMTMSVAAPRSSVMTPRYNLINIYNLSSHAKPSGTVSQEDLDDDDEEDEDEEVALTEEQLARQKAKQRGLLPKIRERKIDEKGRSYGTGRRKTSVARVWVFEGCGQVTVNDRNVTEYFEPDERHHALSVFHHSKTSGFFDVWCTVKGGGKMGIYLIESFLEFNDFIFY